jgi:hypothetical protein
VETANIYFIKALAKMSKFFLGTDNLPPDIATYISGPSMLGDYPTDWCETLDKPLVLLLDEVVSEMFNSNYSREITPALIDLAKERLIDQRQTYLDSLADKIDDSQI